MEYLKAYKKLDNLCKDTLGSDKGITTYIEELCALGDNTLMRLNIKQDLKKLIHCRHIRNQIVHDDGATEQNTCDIADIKYVQNFYNRIINQTDPLSIYEKSKSKRTTRSKAGQKRKNAAKSKNHGGSKTGKIAKLIVVIALLFVLSILAKYYDGARVSTGHEPKLTISIYSEGDGRITYWGLGYKVVRYVATSPQEPYSDNVGVKMGSWFMQYDKPLQ